MVSKVSEGQDNFEKGAVGINGYGFVFKNFDNKSKNSFMIPNGSSKLSSFGAFKDIYKKFIKNQKKVPRFEKLLKYDPKLDLYIGGALRSLVPELKFGGYEHLFGVWLLVKTPKNQIFPMTLYYDQSGTSIGAWTSNYYIFTEEKVFSQQFEALINFSPFSFSNIELEEFIEALGSSLNKVPISDFEGVYTHDLGKNLMGIRSGKPFIETIENECQKGKKKEDTWSYSILGNDLAMDFFYDYIKILGDYLTHDEKEQYPNETPEDLQKTLIERSYEHLVDHAHKQKSRLAFIVLGDLMMSYRAKMTEDLKQLILEYSDWKYEKEQLKNKKDRIERKRFLNEFRKKIKEYDGTEEIIIPLHTVTHVINEKKVKGENTPIWLQNIDYTIKE
ncbi:MAG TPA: hypothetical protein ENH75_09405 [archaeon]|nr:hypothetical protein [archaeon]